MYDDKAMIQSGTLMFLEKGGLHQKDLWDPAEELWRRYPTHSEGDVSVAWCGA